MKSFEKIKKLWLLVKRLKQDKVLGQLIEFLSGNYDFFITLIRSNKFTESLSSNSNLWLALIENRKNQDLTTCLLSDPDLKNLIAHLADDDKAKALSTYLISNKVFRDSVAYLANDKGSRILTQMLLGFIQSQPGCAGYLQRILQAWDDQSSFTLFIELSNWVSSQNEDFRSVLQELDTKDKLAVNFLQDLNKWESQLKLEKIKSQSCIRELYLAELFPNIGEIKLPVGVIHEESHHSNQVDMLYVCAIAAFLQARQIFEFGTYRGQTTCGLAAIAADVKVTTLNLPPEKDPRYAPYIGQFIKTSPYRDRITQIFADAYEFDPFPYTNQMDFIFVDADHSYEGIENDSKKALQMLRPGGVIVWHDYAAKTPGVYEFIRDFSKERPVFQIRNTCLVVYWDGVDAYHFTPHLIPPSLETAEYSPDSSLFQSKATDDC
jgi:predicted O-methyltransferase YrrM